MSLISEYFSIRQLYTGLRNVSWFLLVLKFCLLVEFLEHVVIPTIYVAVLISPRVTKFCTRCYLTFSNIIGQLLLCRIGNCNQERLVSVASTNVSRSSASKTRARRENRCVLTAGTENAPCRVYIEKRTKMAVRHSPHRCPLIICEASRTPFCRISLTWKLVL